MADNKNQKTGYIDIHSGCLYDVLTYSCCGYEHAESNTDPGATEIEQNYCPNCGAKIVDKPPVCAVFSIKREYAELILNGNKLVEYRRSGPAEMIDEMIIYETAPTSKVVGTAQIKLIVKQRPDTLWKMTYTVAGIDKETFDEYFKGCDLGCAFVLTNPERFTIPKPLSDYGITHPPQSFCYLKEDRQ